MKLLRDNLRAFYEVYKWNSFTKAAKAIHLTQSALSHRIRNLEQELEVTLFDREPTGIRLTDAGTKLLRYCQTQIQIEEELLRDLNQVEEGEFSGTLRIGSVSSLAWSILTPSIGRIIRENPGIHLDIIAREVSELPVLFKRGRIDLLMTNEQLNEPSLEEHFLGTETYVLIEPKVKTSRKDIYLDHQEEDKFTFNFLTHEKRKIDAINRSFMDDNHGLIAGVKEGFGKAFVPLHNLKNEKNVVIKKKSKGQKHPVYLYYKKQPFYTKLHQAIVSEICSCAPRLLK